MKELRSKLTSNTALVSQIFAKGTFPIDVEIIAHETTITDKTEPPTLFATSKYLMAIISHLSIGNAFFVILPKSLDTTSTFIFVSHVVPESSLNASGHVMPITISHSLKSKELYHDVGQDLHNKEGTKHAVSGFFINAFVTPICHSSFEIPVSLRIFSHPDLGEPFQVYSPA